MRFGKIFAAAASLALSAMAGQAQAAPFFHYDVSYDFTFASYPQFNGSGTVSFDRSIYRTGGFNILGANDNVTCTYTAGSCGRVILMGNHAFPGSMKDNALSVDLIVPTEAMTTGFAGIFPANTFKTPGTFSYSTIVENVRLTVTNFDQKISAPVPEPATWLLMIFGMGAVGTVLRRRSEIRAMSPA